MRAPDPTALAAGAVRLAFAAWFLARPDDTARTLGVAPTPALRTLARAVAAREVVFGTGTVAAAVRGGPSAPWLRAMAAADTLDGTAITVATLRGAVPRGRGLSFAAGAVAGAASELWSARRAS